MANKILVPTDFSVDSLLVVKDYLNTLDSQQQTDIVFAHGYDTGNSIQDLLFLSKQKLLQKADLQQFNHALHILKNKYGAAIGHTSIEVFTGWNRASFSHFLEGNKIDLVVFPSSHTFKRCTKNSFDLIPLIRKAKYPKQEISMPEVAEYNQEFNDLSVLFTAKVST